MDTGSGPSEHYPLRAPRYSIVGKVELMDVQSETRLLGSTINLSRNGCFVEATPSFSQGANVRLRISRDTAGIVAVGRVAHSEPKGMGIAFVTIETGGLAILDNWIAGVQTQ